MNFLLFMKHRLTFLWILVEYWNGVMVGCFWGTRINLQLVRNCQEATAPDMIFRRITESDLSLLEQFFAGQSEETYRYFKPHSFDAMTLRRLCRNRSFRMLGAWNEHNDIMGYFLMRFFVNRQVFVGFLVGNDFQGRGLAGKMGRIALKSGWDCGFRTLATVSEANTRALNAYRRINNFTIHKELADHYLLIEYTPGGMKD